MGTILWRFLQFYDRVEIGLLGSHHLRVRSYESDREQNVLPGISTTCTLCRDRLGEKPMVERAV